MNIHQQQYFLTKNSILAKFWQEFQLITAQTYSLYLDGVSVRPGAAGAQRRRAEQEDRGLLHHTQVPAGKVLYQTDRTGLSSFST